jgi:hypothetical protein
VALLAGLQAHGVAVAQAVAAGQLRVCTAEEVYLTDGRFDPARAIDVLGTYISEAVGDGYAGLRVVGDMAWVLRDPPGVPHLSWYEAQVNRLFLDGQAMAVCLYNRRLFEASLLRRAACAHPATTPPGRTQTGSRHYVCAAAAPIRAACGCSAPPTSATGRLSLLPANHDAGPHSTEAAA